MPDRAVSTVVAERWAKANNNMPYFETSAKDGTNVEEAFRTIARIVRQDTVDVQINGTVLTSQADQAKASSCCM